MPTATHSNCELQLTPRAVVPGTGGGCSFQVLPPSVVETKAFGPTATQSLVLEHDTELSSGAAKGSVFFVQVAPASVVVSASPEPSAPAPTATHDEEEEHETESKPPTLGAAPPGVGMSGPTWVLRALEPEASETEGGLVGCADTKATPRPAPVSASTPANTTAIRRCRRASALVPR
jgi:hypothetical protein